LTDNRIVSRWTRTFIPGILLFSGRSPKRQKVNAIGRHNQPHASRTHRRPSCIIQGILATGRQAARTLLRDRNDLPNDIITAVVASGVLEQVTNRGADFRLGVVGAKVSIELV
jgi:hypothetical protein